MSQPESVNWGELVEHNDSQLRVSFKVPSGWKAEKTPDCPLKFIVPPLSGSDYRVSVRLFCNYVSSSGSEMLPYAAEQIFAAGKPAVAPEYFATEPASLTVGSFPAVFQRSSWKDASLGEIRQVTVVAQAWDRLYIYNITMDEATTEAATGAFMQMLMSMSYEMPGSEKVEEPVVPAPLSSPQPEAPNTRRFEDDGTWRRKSRI
jgi:hypothetical protein